VWPWFRVLASNYAELLENCGFDVAILTKENPWDKDSLKFCGLEISEKLGIRSIKEMCSMFWFQWKYRPDIIIQEPTSDLRFIFLNSFSSAMTFKAIHDPKPHDSTHIPNQVKGVLLRLSTRKSRETICFSAFSQTVLKTEYRWKLLPEIPLSQICPPEICEQKKNFVVFGRISPYQNIDFLVDNWQTFGKLLGQEELHIYGWAKKTFEGPGVVHFNRRFVRSELLSKLCTYRAALFPYLSVTQSGTLLLAQSSGLAVLTTNLEGFKEFLHKEQNDFIDIKDGQKTLRTLQKYLNPDYLLKKNTESLEAFRMNLAQSHNDIGDFCGKIFKIVKGD
jgi:glycosyltransferase involved in cell wall biosynthesis